METLVRVVEAQGPMTVRGAYYAASVAGAVDKTEGGYRKVSRLLVKMREENLIAWSAITDGTRWRRGPVTYRGIDEALQDTARLYRRGLWEQAPERVEVWLEKEALAGVVVPITAEWTVDLMVCRGYPSRTFLYSAIEDARAQQKPLVIYYLGDHDPSGADIPRYIRAEFEKYDADFRLVQLAVLPEQIDEWDLPTRPTKRSDSRSNGFDSRSVELDAIPPDRLRSLVDDAIREHVDERQVAVLRAYEDDERRLLHELARRGA
ncbi:MAG: hypothetical protein ACR2NB_06090 [Solirubrobacteraceae bacterium]